jgi:hypothetical protein
MTLLVLRSMQIDLTLEPPLNKCSIMVKFSRQESGNSSTTVLIPKMRNTTEVQSFRSFQFMKLTPFQSLTSLVYTTILVIQLTLNGLMIRSNVLSDTICTMIWIITPSKQVLISSTLMMCSSLLRLFRLQKELQRFKKHSIEIK